MVIKIIKYRIQIIQSPGNQKKDKFKGVNVR